MTFHPGELELQRRAGLQAMAAKVGRIIGDSLTEEAAEFLEQQPLVLLGHRDSEGRVRVTPLTGRPRFVRVTEPRLIELSGPALPGGEAGLLAIDFRERIRLRVNGTLEPRNGGSRLRAREVYWNCAKYIQARSIEAEAPREPAPVRRSALLTPDQEDLIRNADTFFIATVPPGQAADVSHRGGNPGFVRIAGGRRLEWADYPGNAMFNTLGNLLLDPEAGLLFVDFQRGTLLHLNGRATVDGGTKRTVALEISEVRETPDGHPYRWSPPEPSPFNRGGPRG
jgi:predicted pyridoxine 5'-phosphate oxidase superfamily flavin-nucleotide-binding protein